VTEGPGFALSAADSALSLSSPGQSASESLSIAPVQGFTGTIVLSCIVAPMPTSSKVPACSLPGGIVLGSDAAKTTLEISSDTTTPPGSYTVAVSAVSGGVQRTLALPLIVLQLAASPDFELTAANSTVSVAASGQSVSDMLTIRPAGGFTGAVQLSCAVSAGSSSTALPTCTVPSTASITGVSVVNAMLTVNTVAPSAALAAKERRQLGERVGGLMLGCLLIFIAPKRRIWTALGVIFLTAAVLTVTACGGSGHSATETIGSPGTPAGSYTATVTAVSGSINAATQVHVTVQ
jgi:hypothetical protein